MRYSGDGLVILVLCVVHVTSHVGAFQINIRRIPTEIRYYDRGGTQQVLKYPVVTCLQASPSSVIHKAKRKCSEAKEKFKSKPLTYCLIPVIAALVGWFTNYLAVQMIFYPIKYIGLDIIRKPNVPLGLLGWQGIVPCKTQPMTDAMVEMVTTQLLSVKEVFKRLNPSKVADLLVPEVPKLALEIGSDILPNEVLAWPKSALMGLPQKSRDLINFFNHRFLVKLVADMQNQIENVFSVRNCVLEQMLADRSLLGQLFQKVGEAELQFLTNSGLWFGFILGLIQMAVALFWDNPWTLSVGGTIVGLATNWLALKWIFEPVNPTKFGPFILQGQFLRRQKEVAAEFSKFFANKILTSANVWHSILNDPVTSPSFNNLFKSHISRFLGLVAGGLRLMPEPEVIKMAAEKAVEKLPQHIGVLHSYIDSNLGLEDTLRTQMEAMSCEKFERVLHPIFEEDELTLIIAGGVLGFLAGLVQQGLETGAITLPSFKRIRKLCKGIWRIPKNVYFYMKSKIRRDKQETNEP